MRLSAAEGNLRNASRSWLEKLETLAFFKKWYVLKKDTPTRRDGRVYVWVSALQARKAQGKAPKVTGEEQTPLTSRLVRCTLSFKRVVPRRDWAR